MAGATRPKHRALQHWLLVWWKKSISNEYPARTYSVTVWYFAWTHSSSSTSSTVARVQFVRVFEVRTLTKKSGFVVLFERAFICQWKRKWTLKKRINFKGKNNCSVVCSSHQARVRKGKVCLKNALSSLSGQWAAEEAYMCTTLS